MRAATIAQHFCRRKPRWASCCHAFKEPAREWSIRTFHGLHRIAFSPADQSFAPARQARRGRFAGGGRAVRGDRPGRRLMAVKEMLIKAGGVAAVWLVGSLGALAEFSVTSKEDRIEILDEGKVVFGWQIEPLDDPEGGEKYAASAFVHPLCTPSGFCLTEIQPDDHRHHFGVWWPWKHLAVDGKKHVTWELQKGEGRHAAVSAEVKKRSADEVVLQAVNRDEIAAGKGGFRTVVLERAMMRFSRRDKDVYVLDIDIEQRPAVEGVEVTRYRYSGFSWRGPGEWKAANSRMLTSGGHDRDNANGKEARWVKLEGPRPGGTAAMLIMSAAAKAGGGAERLRVWSSEIHHGLPFVNFNPVVEESLPMKPEQREVARRRYRLVLADRAISAKEAKELWEGWEAANDGSLLPEAKGS